MRRPSRFRGRRRKPRPKTAVEPPAVATLAERPAADVAPDRESQVGDLVRLVCPEAPRVVERLERYGFETYLCGGCVRDLLLDLRPKDFDIATNATPRQVKRLFRNSRVIGRRFRLVQLSFPSTILEVSTFRAAIDPPSDRPDLLILQDNVFGTAEEDARRRDFTVNGLFYDLRRNRVIDFVGGVRDLDRRVVETIGDPWVRFREDPVRMLRAVKFASRLGFRVAEDAYAAILDCRDELKKAAPARVHEELIRLHNMGAARDASRLLYRVGATDVIAPELHEALDALGDDGRRRYWAMFSKLDAAVREGFAPSTALLFSFLFWPLLTGPTADVDAFTSAATRLRMSRRDGQLVRLYAAEEPPEPERPRGRRRRRRSPSGDRREESADAAFFRAASRDDDPADDASDARDA